MLRILLFIVHTLELCLYTWLFHRCGGGSVFDWLVTVLATALGVRAAITALTMVLAQVPLRPLSITFAAFASEFTSIVRFYSFDGMRSTPRLSAPQTPRSDHAPVLFIHGFMCNAGFWREYLKVFRQRWGNHVATIDLEPLHANIDDYSARIDARVDELLATSGASQCLIVAHSMGGLATRSYLRNLNAHKKIGGVITHGTPHSGTMFAHLSFSKNGKQMRRLSGWLKKLREAENEEILPHFDSIIGTHDNIVAPQDCAVFDLADNTYVTGLSHLAMAHNHTLIELTLERLKRMSDSAS